MVVIIMGMSLISNVFADSDFASKYNEYQNRVKEGKASFDKGCYREAITHYSRAIEISPFEASFYYDRGISYYRTGDIGKAREDFNRTIILDSRRSSAYVYRGLCLEKMSDYSGAIQDYTHALQLNPKDANIHNNLAWLYSTSKDKKFFKKDKALEYAQKAANLSERKNAEILDTLAKAFFINGRITEAIETEKEALKLFPDNEEFKRNLRIYKDSKGL